MIRRSRLRLTPQPPWGPPSSPPRHQRAVLRPKGPPDSLGPNGASKRASKRKYVHQFEGASNVTTDDQFDYSYVSNRSLSLSFYWSHFFIGGFNLWTPRTLRPSDKGFNLRTSQVPYRVEKDKDNKNKERRSSSGAVFLPPGPPTLSPLAPSAPLSVLN